MSIETHGGLLPLLVWTSPAFPVGAFAYSHGLEWAVESGAVRDAVGLEAWLRDLLDHGAPRNDTILAACAYRSVMNDGWNGAPSRAAREKLPRGCRADEGAGESLDPLGPRSSSEDTTHAAHLSALLTTSRESGLVSVNELALALVGSRERHLETTQQGNAFVLAARAAWPCEALDRLVAAVAGDIAYPVAFATAAAAHAVPPWATLQALALGGVANLISAAVRLGMVGQTDGQRVLAALADPVRQLATAAAAATIDDLGTAAFASDLAALRHETQYSRLFRS